MISKKAKDTLKSSKASMGRIADAFLKSLITVERWIEGDSPMLETPTALQIIREETGMSDEEILVQEPANK